MSIARYFILRLVFLALLLSFPGDARAGKPQRFEFESLQMGVSVRLVLYTEDAETANKAAQAAFNRFAELNAIMSDYDSDSELSRLSAASGETEGPIPVSPDLFAILDASKRYSVLSDGAFDVTVGPLVRLWRRARRQRELPKDQLVRQARRRVGNDLWELDREKQTVRLKQQGMRFDLGGIAKGYGIDQAFEAIRKHGITVQLVDAGGDMRLGDAPPDGWKIEMNDGMTLAPENIALATSGDRFRFVEIGGVRYSHIIDPKTGLGLTHSSTVYVTALTATEADALASALSVMAPEAGIQLADSLENVAAKIVLGDGKRTFQSKNWQE